MRMQIIEANELRCSIYQIINSEPGIISSAVASAIEAMLGTADIPEGTMTSPTAPRVTHRWTNLNAYADEVAAARIAAGFHYRFSTVVGQGMGRQIGAVRSDDAQCRAGTAMTRGDSDPVQLRPVANLSRRQRSRPRRGRASRVDVTHAEHWR